jgi:signal transduction histidine kinase
MDIIHDFAKNLRPLILDDLGLSAALKSFIKEFSLQSKIRVKFEADQGIEDLSNCKKTVLYRIAKEALSNIAKHAKAKKASLTIEIHKTDVVMQVKDNGVSFNLKKFLKSNNGVLSQKRIGLLGMEERMRIFHGTFSIDSKVGKGTKVSVSMPIAEL